jgi:hypothetical protein
MTTEQNDPDGNNEYSFSSQEKKGLYKAIFSRRDVRSHFLTGKDIPDDVLVRVAKCRSSCALGWFFAALEFCFD